MPTSLSVEPGYSFNAPPGWPPVPHGWTPPPGWTADPSWPAAPDGWVWYTPIAALIKKKSWPARHKVLTLLAAIVLLIVFGQMASGGTSSTPTATTTEPITTTPEPTPTTEPSPSVVPSPTVEPTAEPVPPVAVVANGLPDRHFTPGSVFLAATVAQICVSGYSSSVRNVSASTRAAVFELYGIATPVVSGAYEVDHLIPLELGGDNTTANLWPESNASGTGFPRKDQLENRLHSLVCGGSLSLATAQHAMATNWIAAASHYSAAPPVRRPAPKAPVPAPAAPAPAPAGVYYANCTAVRAAGAAPIHRGEPGYSSKLDRDGDGIACE